MSEELVINKSLASRLDLLVGSPGSAYWKSSIKSFYHYTTISHLRTICAESNLNWKDFELIIIDERESQLKEGYLGDYKGWAMEVMTEEPLFDLMFERAQTNWGTNYWLLHLINTCTNGLAFYRPYMLKNPWQQLLAHNRKEFGSILTSESIMIWNNRIDTYRLPIWMKL